MSLNAISLELFGAIINSIGVGVGAIISVAVLAKYRNEYFRPWTLGYIVIFLIVVFETIYVNEPTRPLPAILSSVILSILAGNFWYETRLGLFGKKLPRHFHAVSVCAGLAICLLLYFAGTPFLTLAIPFIFYFTGLEVWLGITFLNKRFRQRLPLIQFLGVAKITSSAFAASYPLFASSKNFWIGFIVQGGFQLFESLMMIVIVFEGIIRDIKLKNIELTELDKLKTTFMTNLSHELRTPLGVILGSTPILLNDEKKISQENSKRLLSMVDNNANRLAELIFDAMDYTQMEAGTLIYHLRPLNLADFVRSVVQERKASLFDAKSITLKLDLPSEKHIVSNIDLERFSRAFGHILSNASKFTQPGGTVEVRLRSLGDRTTLEIADTGIGISREHLDKIFGKFYQVDSGLSRQYGGSGLGLAFAKSVIENGHSGTLEVESQLGVGTRFKITLPNPRQI